MEENNIVHQARFFRSWALALRSGLPCPPPGPLPALRGSVSSQPSSWMLTLPVPWLSSPRRQTDGSGKEWWVTNNTYWRLRSEPGYGNLDGAVLW